MNTQRQFNPLNLGKRSGLLAGIALAYLGLAQEGFGQEQDTAGAPRVVSEFESKLRPFIEAHCVRCHGPRKSKARLRLDQFSYDIQDEAGAQSWQLVLDRLNAGEMPPEDELQPETKEMATAIAALSDGLLAAQERLAATGGVVLRKLNKREYENTIRDLLGISIDTKSLPEDGNLGGFDTVGAAHFISQLHFERYHKLARRALDVALGVREKPASIKVRSQVELVRNREVDAIELKCQNQLKNPTGRDRASLGRRMYQKSVVKGAGRYRQLPSVQSGAVLGSPRTPFTRGTKNAILRVPLPNREPGVYRLRFRAGLAGPFDGELDAGYFMSVYHIDGWDAEQTLNESLDTVKLVKSFPEAQEFEYRFEKLSRSKQFIEFQLTEATQDLLLSKVSRSKGEVVTAVWVDWVEMEGPLVPVWPPPVWESVFFAGTSPAADEELAYAREVIRRFALRAFRQRKPSEEYIDGLLGLFQEYCLEGLSFVDAVQESLAIVLVSPGFLYLVEGDAARIDQRELACRLSYFLWSAPPDEELLELVAKGQLADPAQLRAQVERLLKDERSAAFTEAFSTQWLELERLDMIVVNRTFRSFGESLRHSFKQESVRFFAELVRQNLSASQFIDSDHAMLDEALAQHYGVDASPMSGFQWVKLPEDSPRGGLIGQGAILTINGNGARTSPVERGVYLSRKLLGKDIPPPPPNVPQLSTKLFITMRERLSAHMEQAQCASCHQSVDPLGFGLEHFDAVGAWRTMDGENEVDALGVMPDGLRKFNGSDELKQHLLEELEPMTEALMKASLTYALGRRIGFADRELLAKLHAAWKAEDYGMRSLVHLLVQSEAFQAK